ncbi:MAG: response regulator [candidate division KSB1 bacterium]|nr:response regulator [candidate division KSB1 bacterium]
MVGLPSYKILIINSESAELEELARLLKEQRHRIEKSDSLEEAFQFLQRERVDALLFEPRLSDDRGKSFIDQLRRTYAEPPIAVIVLTEEADHERRIELLELDIDDLLQKPFDPREAMTRIDVLLGRMRPLVLDESGQGDGLSGSLMEMGVADLIQTVIIADKSAIIHLQHKTETARIEVQKGEVCGIHSYDQSAPIEALLNLLAWEEGRFSIEFRNEIGKPKLGSEDRARIAHILRSVEQLHEIIGEPFSLQTKYVANSSNFSGTLSSAERSVLLLFLEPSSIRRALALSTLEAEQVLQCIHSLIRKGLLLKTEDYRRAEDEQFVFNPVSGGTVLGAKQQFSRIFSLFRQGAPLISSGESPAGFYNRPRLSKAELMLIRQKFA